MSEAELLRAARAGDARAFEALVGPHRAALLGHCYRLTACCADAEDAVQDALVRAWRGVGGYDGRGVFRAWLFRIATNAALTGRTRRTTTDRLVPAAKPGDAPGAPLEDAFVEPCPPAFWSHEVGPEARLSAKESIALAFVALVQELPASQRAVLVLRDVLGWSAEETADTLETTVAAVNSALQRARASIDRWRATEPRGSDERLRELAGRYVRAWESGDPAALAALLHADARLTMPPVPLWFEGREAIAGFLQGLFVQLGERRVVELEASGGPAFATYVRAGGALRLHSISVVHVAGSAVDRMDAFADPAVLKRFLLPAELG